eukprot:g4265.t1
MAGKRKRGKSGKGKSKGKDEGEDSEAKRQREESLHMSKRGAYYRRQQICSEADFLRLLETFQTGLPVAIRTKKADLNHPNEVWRKAFPSFEEYQRRKKLGLPLTGERDGGGDTPVPLQPGDATPGSFGGDAFLANNRDPEMKCYAPQKLSWYSHGLGWMWPGLERRVIKKEQRHAGLKEYLAQRERAGLISRQEALDPSSRPTGESDSDDDSYEDDLANFGEDISVPDEHVQSAESSSDTSDSTEAIASSRDTQRRRSSIRTMMGEASRTSCLQHLQAAISVLFGAHLHVDTEEEGGPDISAAAKRLLGPLGKSCTSTVILCEEAGGPSAGRVGFAAPDGAEVCYNASYFLVQLCCLDPKGWSVAVRFFRKNYSSRTSSIRDCKRGCVTGERALGQALAFWLGFWISFIGLPNYALTARKLIYGDTEKTRDLLDARQVSWTHYWCDLSDSGLSEEAMLNVTDCTTTRLGDEETGREA